ncbi:MAG: ribonuclease III [Acidimicrobiia bacterium]
MTLEDQLGYSFANPALLRLALTHRSVSADNPSRNDNERLEFLGDAVLQLVITDRLYDDFPQLAEGKMAKVRAAVVSRPSLADVARDIDLGNHIELAPAEERTGGRNKDSILADALEAILGAIYLDGGLDSARVTIDRVWGDRVAKRARRPGVKDYKTRLQEVLAKEGFRPAYETEGSGPDHARVFLSQVSVDGRQLGEGDGRSKKEAEQGAARKALETLSSDSQSSDPLSST